MLASIVLRLFCGIRTTEMCSLNWRDVRWLDEKPTVLIPAGIAKKRRIRGVDIPTNALAWLKLCNPPAEGAIVQRTQDNPRTHTKAYCTRFNRVVKAAGIGREDKDGKWLSDWESNDTRHSFGSYHYALHGDALRTAAQLGHKQNDEVLFTYYRKWARKQDAEAFFAIVPDAGAGKVTDFPRAATA
jgi:integrase